MEHPQQKKCVVHDDILFLVGGWFTPLKNMKVNWDDEIPNISVKIKLMFQTTNQMMTYFLVHKPLNDGLLLCMSCCIMRGNHV